ncbi:MAG: transposase [Candidatus Marinimicrobia bacterium]|nr:transposase [Candidatus Neomarinimicrobiota bacterium]
MISSHLYNPQKHNRRRIRLHGYDYSLPNLYFITICTKNRKKIFGEIVEMDQHQAMQLSDIGQVVEWHWQKIPNHFKNVKLHEFIIMPNHIHGIIEIFDNSVAVKHSCKNNQLENYTVGTQDVVSKNRSRHVVTLRPIIVNDMINNIGRGEAFLNNNQLDKRNSKKNASPLQNNHPNGTTSRSLNAIIQNFKSITSRKINNIQNTPGNTIWQRNYYEHIIRNEKSHQKICDYIRNNPIQWQYDKYYK